MKIALINADGPTGKWASHLQQATEHRLAVVYGQAPILSQTGLQQQPADQWEALLHETEVDAVLVGTGTDRERLAEQLTRIVQAGLPMIVAHPVAGLLDCFSLQMIQRETRSLIYPLVANADEDAIGLLRNWVQSPNESPIGEIEQLAMEAMLPCRDRADATRQFAIDAFLVRRILGGIDKFNAVGVDPAVDDWSRLRIQMVSDVGAPVSWGMISSPGSHTGTLKLLGSQGSARVSLEDFPKHWQIRIAGAPDAVSFDAPRPRDPFDLAAQAIESDDPRPELWDDACRSLELADLIEYSARRGKTVELYETEVSETGTFRSMMAAGGCLLLFGTLAATLLLVVVESVWSIGGIMRYAPWAVLATVLVAFLSLQLLNLVLPKK